ncbi:MAG: hypothetical protein GY704_04855, partial [Phycisphaeraceae bacterium]|nr:hypothetical protein [Phycisphaeraceae bacterium]
MRIAFVGLLLGTALLVTACGESESSDEESTYARRALEAFSAGIDSPALDPDPLDPGAAPGGIPDSTFPPSDETSRTDAPPDGDSGVRREGSFLVGMGKWRGARAFWTFLGGGGVLVNAPAYGQAALILLDALQPIGVSGLALDSVGLMAPLGAVAMV